MNIQTIFMTNMSDTDNYFKQQDVAMSFALHAVEEETGIAVMTETAGALPHNYNEDNNRRIIAGFRMDGDDTLMSAEERLQIISSQKNYKVSA